MLVTTRQGRRVTIPAHHPVYRPVGDYRDGDQVDYARVDVDSTTACRLKAGEQIILDNRVEVVRTVLAV